MLNRKQLLRFMIETVLLSAVSVIVMLLGIFATNSSEYARVQNSYMANFSNVLDADSYDRIQSNLIEGYSGVNAVYEGVDANGTPAGFVVEGRPASVDHH